MKTSPTAMSQYYKSGMHSKTCLTIAYFAFGLLHELAHLLVALCVCQDRVKFYDMIQDSRSIDPFSSPPTLRAWLKLVLQIAVGRSISFHYSDEHDFQNEGLIRASGWVLSTLLAIFLWRFTSLCIEVKIAATITALEAVTTDLLGLGCPPINYGTGMLTQDTGRVVTFFCGNFGLVLVHAAWTENEQGRTKALQMLQSLAQITMLRGAQAGGVLCWTPENRSGESYKGIQSRVVNAKRSDLSKKIHHRVQRDTRWLWNRPRTYIGHTRFATSSKATLDGTHPHHWSKPTYWKVYHPSKLEGTHGRSVTPVPTRVENYVTHNGDFDFFRTQNGQFRGLSIVQAWLQDATGFPMPSAVDSAAIAGAIDILRTQYCFGLSIRFSLTWACLQGDIRHAETRYPSIQEYETLAVCFETSLAQVCQRHKASVEDVARSFAMRQELVNKVMESLEDFLDSLPNFRTWIASEDMEAIEKIDLVQPFEFVRTTVAAFFDNDLFHATNLFLEHAKGSFGLVVTSSLDAHRQIVLATRGQSMSVAVYPRKGLICYGSEPAAVKAALSVQMPGGDLVWKTDSQEGDNLLKGDLAFRIDLDDLGGEICLVDWGDPTSSGMISFPHRHLQRHVTMQGKATLIFYEQNKAIHLPISEKTMMLEENEAIQPILKDTRDPILQDIRDIPRVCQKIQDTWNTTSLNRLTSCHLIRCLRSRLDDKIDGKIPSHSRSIDILLTGCEVSLWVAEQFATDLQKCFPCLNIKSVSSNKLLGVFGQELMVPAIGYPMSQSTHDLSNTIVIIVSHSGGTFAPLACSNLLQSKTTNIFVVTREWDTQIGRQLRCMSHGIMALVNNRIFSTESGIRVAEPCSVSVAAQHQVLTQILVDIATAILDHKEYCRVSGAVIQEEDITTLLRCNRANLTALEMITGTSRDGKLLPSQKRGVEKELREMGRLWSDHVLENARAYIMTFAYVIITVTSGWPLVTGIAHLLGMDMGEYLYFARFFDSLLYFFLPQINIIILRLVQKRNLRHRMISRTVVIGDIPWVAQAADSFLSKIFACSYSIAGVHVLHGNPSDHLIHRHTHRIARGTLLVCGRPDGRLMALTSTEATICLTVNQASSIQSFRGTCETVTIGHNPYRLALTKKDIVLPTYRPKYLCEQMLEEDTFCELSELNTSPQSLHSAYMGWKAEAVWEQPLQVNCDTSRDFMVDAMIRDRGQQKRFANTNTTESLLKEVDSKANGHRVGLNNFLKFYSSRKKQYLQHEDFVDILKSIDRSRHSTIDLYEFVRAVDQREHVARRKTEKRRRRIEIKEELSEDYVGQTSRQMSMSVGKVADYALAEAQKLNIELYESRCASMQRFVAMTVMFHEMGGKVQSFFPAHSAGLLGYRMDRTHSILGIATTASPVSGADVRERIERLHHLNTIENAVRIISSAWARYRAKEAKKLFKQKNTSRRLVVRGSLENFKQA